MQDVVIVPANGNIAFTSSNGEVISLQITESAGNPLLVFSGTSSPLFHFSGSSVFVSGLSGSLTQLADGSPYIEGQGTVTVTTASDGHVIISGTGDGGSGGGGSSDGFFTYMPQAPFDSPSSFDDEFDSGSLDSRWYTWDVPGTLTQSLSKSRLILEQPTAAGDSWNGVLQAAPSSSFTVYAQMDTTSLEANFASTGLIIGDDLIGNPSGEDFEAWAITGNTSEAVIEHTRWIDYNSFSATRGSLTNTYRKRAFYFRLRYTAGTNAIQSDYSHDGFGWINFASGTLSFTPETFGFAVNNVGSGDKLMAFFDFIRVVEGTDAYSGTLGNSVFIKTSA